MEVKVNVDVLQVGIDSLKTLQSEYKTNTIPLTEIISKGHTSENMQLVKDTILATDTAFDQLISNTIDFLENAKDSFIEVDEKTAKIFNTLIEEVNKHE